MHTRFVCALSVTICKILAIKNFACIVTRRVRIFGAFPCIASDFPRTVRPKLADTNFGRSLSLCALFLCHNGPIGIFGKVVRKWWSPSAHWRSGITAPMLKQGFLFAHWRSGITAHLRSSSPKITIWAEALFIFLNFGLKRLLAHQPGELSFQHKYSHNFSKLLFTNKIMLSITDNNSPMVAVGRSVGVEHWGLYLYPGLLKQWNTGDPPPPSPYTIPRRIRILGRFCWCDRLVG